MALSAGTRLGPYEILAPLGAGAMGEVYRARNPRLARDVALKVLPSHLTASPGLRGGDGVRPVSVSQTRYRIVSLTFEACSYGCAQGVCGAPGDLIRLRSGIVGRGGREPADQAALAGIRLCRYISKPAAKSQAWMDQ